MTWKQTSRTTIIFPLSLNNHSAVFVQIQLAGGNRLPAAFLRCVPAQLRCFPSYTSPSQGQLAISKCSAAQSTLGMKRSGGALWPHFRSLQKTFLPCVAGWTKSRMCTHFLVRTLWFSCPGRASRSFRLGEFHLLIATICQIKIEKWIEENQRRRGGDVTTQSVASGKLHCTLVKGWVYKGEIPP